MAIIDPPWTLDIPTETPSLNTWQRMHFQERRRVKTRWVLQVRKAAHQAGILRVGATVVQRKLYGVGGGPVERRRITVTSYRWALCDYDRLVGGLVPLIDALVRVRLIVDDAPRWLEHGAHRQIVDRTNRRTVVLLEPVVDEAEEGNGGLA